jgi:hypothetical protein
LERSNLVTMRWRELSDFLHRQRTEISVRPISEFAEVGEKAADTFKRLEAATRDSLKTAIREFARTRKWAPLSDEQSLILYFRLSQGVDLAMALSQNKTGLFSTRENDESEMIRWALNEAWEHPGLPNTVRFLSDRRHLDSGEKWN